MRLKVNKKWYNSIELHNNYKVIIMHYILLKHCNFFVQPSEDVTCVVRATNAKIHVDTKHTLLWRRLDELLQNILQCQVCWPGMLKE